MGFVKEVYRKYILGYIIQGLAAFALIFITYLVSNAFTPVSAEALAKVDGMRETFLISSVLLLVVIFAAKCVVFYHVSRLNGIKDKMNLLYKSGLIINCLPYIMIILGVALIIKGDSFSNAKYVFFTSIVMFCFSMIRYTRWRDLSGEAYFCSANETN